MPLNYTSWVVWKGNKQGVLEIHHEFLRTVIEDETTVLVWEGLASIKGKRKDAPDRDELTFQTVGGKDIKLEVEVEIEAIVASIPRSYHIGW